MKSQDILVAVELLLQNGKKITFAQLGKSLQISASETHGAINRLKESFIYDSFTKMIRKTALEEFLIHGIQYAFPASLGKPARGVLTGYSSPFMRDDFNVGKNDDVYIWPYSNGKDRGISIQPLYRSAPEVCLKNESLYHWLSTIDMLRLNRARQREIAIIHLQNLFKDIK
ncbi:MAG: hypothetical protein JW841_00660 [Deltaproteobacteria bacterium]|nr:hypothetical protein [Deltaproteobacteria bacterium]